MKKYQLFLYDTICFSVFSVPSLVNLLSFPSAFSAPSAVKRTGERLD